MRAFWKWLFVSAIVGSFVYMYLDEKIGPTMVKLNSMVYNVSRTQLGLTERTDYGVRSNFRRGVSSIDTNASALNLTSLARYIHFSVQNNIAKCSARRYIVYTCRNHCGGWGDRLKGITSLFLLAQLTNRTFLIDMPTPCDLMNFVIPNMYDWNTCLYSSKLVPKEKIKNLTLMSRNSLNKINEFVNGTLKDFQVIRIQTNKIAFQNIKQHLLANSTMPWIHTLSLGEVTGSIIGILFKPTKNITKQVEKFYLNKIGGKSLVCGHIRYGKNPTLPTDTSLRDGPPNVTTVLQFLKTYDEENNVIFVATDSDNVRDTARKTLTNFISTEKKIVHIDKTKREPDTSCQGFSTALFEQVILSACDVLVLTRSNFGAMAAYMRGHSQNIFLNFKTRKDIFNVTLSGIQETYHFV